MTAVLARIARAMSFLGYFCCLLSLTLGTLPLHVDAARSVLYVHGLHVGSPRRFREALRRMEDHMLRVMR